MATGFPKPVYAALTDVLSVAGASIRQGAHLPSLILVYSYMDAVGWLGSSDPNPHSDATAETFCNWVERYLFPQRRLACSAPELYAARCGVLHTFTADSRMARRGDARRVVYAWGPKKADEVQPYLDERYQADVVALHIDDLYDGLRLGTAQMFEDALHDLELAQRMSMKALGFFEFMSGPAAAGTSG